MASLAEQLLDHGIRLPNYSPGDRKVTCPRCSHERRNRKDPCLSVHIDPDGEGAVWMCHHCDWRGNTKDPFERTFERPQRARQVQPPPPRRTEMPGWTMVEWFRKRGIPEEVLVKNRIGEVEHYMPQMAARVPCIAFPYYRDGALISVKYRALQAKAFARERGGESAFYGLDQLVPGERIIIVEGELDKLAADTCGLENTLSVPDGAPAKLRGEPSPNDPKFEYLRADSATLDSFTRFVIAVDNDSAGDVLAEELARRLGRERCYRVRWPDQGDTLCKDLNETLVAHGAAVVRECIEAAEPYPIKGYHLWEEQVLIDRKTLGLERGVSTGWASLDEYVTIAPGQFSVVTGIPNHGKSEFIDALAVNLAKRHGWRFAMCSFENSIPEHEAKLAEKYLGIPFWDTRSRAGMTTDDIRKASEWGRQHFWFIRSEDDSPTIDWLLEKARIAVLRDGIHGLVIDPYNEIEHARPANMNETEYVSQILGKVKRFAQNHGVHVWFVAHPQKLHRENGKMPVPGLYDISGSAHWANKADIGMIVYRADPETSEVEIHLAKVRHKWVGKPGKVVLTYDRATGCYNEPVASKHWADL